MKRVLAIFFFFIVLNYSFSDAVLEQKTPIACKATAIAEMINRATGSNFTGEDFYDKNYTGDNYGICMNIQGKKYGDFVADYKRDSDVKSKEEQLMKINESLSRGIPIVVQVSPGNPHHWVVILRAEGNSYWIADPDGGVEMLLSSKYSLGTNYQHNNVDYYGYVALLPTVPVKVTLSTVNLIIDNQDIGSNLPQAYNIDGSNYFKLRDLGALSEWYENSIKKFNILWDGVKNSIKIISNSSYSHVGNELIAANKDVNLMAFRSTAQLYVNEMPVSISAYNINGNNYYKLRDVASIINVGVNYDGNTNTIRINSLSDYAAPENSTLISPSNNSVHENTSPTLTWNSVYSPSGSTTKYWVETFDCPMPEKSDWITDTKWTPNSKTPGKYNWHVKTLDTATGKESGWGNVWQYSISSNSTLGAPILDSPSNLLIPGIVPTLRWHSASPSTTGRDQYWFETFSSNINLNSGWIDSLYYTPSWTMDSPGFYQYRVKARNLVTGFVSSFSESGLFAVISKVYNPPNVPTIISPTDYTKISTAAPVLNWSSVTGPSGGTVEYKISIFDSPLNIESYWMTDTSWRPSELDGKPGLYLWRVKSIDKLTGKESGWSNPVHFEIVKGDSTDLRLDIRRALYGVPTLMIDTTQKVRTLVTNDSFLSLTASNSLTDFDPSFGNTKTLTIIYRNRWNEEYSITVNEGNQINIDRESRIGTFILDGDN